MRHGSRDEILGEARRIDAALAAAPRGRRRGSAVMSELLLLLGIGLAASSGVAGLLFRRQIQRRAMAGHG